MANWCSNTVVFEGSLEAIEQIKWLFQAMATIEQQEQKGQLQYAMQKTFPRYSNQKSD